MNLSAGKTLLKTNYYISRFLVSGIKNTILNRAQPVEKRREALNVTASVSRDILSDLGVEVKATYSGDKPFDRNYFMVCNHMSYLDILCLSSVQPAVFVTSVEMEKTFFLGDMAKLGGSFFVNRINRRKMKDEVAAMVKLLEDDFNVFLFPEGTSTNGSEILPFKKSLFRVPFQTGLPILPICLKYKKIDGEDFSPANADRVCWYGDMTFGPHFLQLMNMKSMEVEVQYLDPLDSTQFESHGDLCVAAEKAIRDAYFG